MSSSRGFIWLDKKTSDGFNGGNIILNDNSVIQFNGGDTIITNDNITANEMIYDDAYEKTPGHGNTHHNKMNFQDDVTIDSTKLLYVDNILPTAGEVVNFPSGLSGFIQTNQIDELTSLAGVTFGNKVAIMGDLSVSNIDLDNIYGTNINLTATAFVNVTGEFGLKADAITGYTADTLSINSTLNAEAINASGDVTLANESLLLVNNIVGSTGVMEPRFPNGLTVETATVWTANIAGIDSGPVNVNTTLNVANDLNVTGAATISGLLDSTSAKFIDTSTHFHNGVDPTKRFSFDCNQIATGQTRVYFLPTFTTTIVGTDSSQTLQNKTITATSNFITATSLRTIPGGAINVTASTPSIGQVLTATSTTAANWQTPPGILTTATASVSPTTPYNMTFTIDLRRNDTVVSCRLFNNTNASAVANGQLTLTAIVPAGFRPAISTRLNCFMDNNNRLLTAIVGADGTIIIQRFNNATPTNVISFVDFLSGDALNVIRTVLTWIL